MKHRNAMDSKRRFPLSRTQSFPIYSPVNCHRIGLASVCAIGRNQRVMSRNKYIPLLTPQIRPRFSNFLLFSFVVCQLCFL